MLFIYIHSFAGLCLTYVSSDKYVYFDLVFLFINNDTIGYSETYIDIVYDYLVIFTIIFDVDNLEVNFNVIFFVIFRGADVGIFFSKDQMSVI